MKQIRERFSELKSSIMGERTIKYYNKFMENKNWGKVKPDKIVKFHLGLATVQKEALME
jgi:hypothetical protein